MPAPALPHRAVFFAPQVTLSPQDQPAYNALASVLARAMFRATIRHPQLAITDPDDHDLFDGQGVAWGPSHPEFQRILGWEFGDARRDDACWLEIAQEAGWPAIVRVHAVPSDGRPPEQFHVEGQAKLSDQIGEAINQWLAARKLAPLPAPLEPFTLEELVQTAHAVARTAGALANNDTAGAQQIVNQVRVLLVPFLRAIGHPLQHQLGIDIDTRVQMTDAQDVEAKRNLFLKTLDQPNPDRRAVMQITPLAPAWGKPWLSEHGDAYTEEEQMYAQSYAAFLMPTNPWAQDNQAISLGRMGRWDEGWRSAERSTRASPRFIRGHATAIRMLRDIGRQGQAIGECGARHSWIEQCFSKGEISPFEWYARTSLALLWADVHFDVGRLEDAIALKEKALSWLQDKTPFKWHVEHVQQLKTDPLIAAQSYARDGHHRREPGRVIEGFARSKVSMGTDVHARIEAFLALGREEDAVLAFAHAQGDGMAGGAYARIAGSKALMVDGQLDRALEQLQIVSLRHPQMRLDTTVLRILRLGAHCPADEWAQVVATRHALGARTIAKLLARDAADFVPGFTPPSGVLPAPKNVAYDPAWLDELKKELGVDTAQVDAFFARYDAATTLAQADEMHEAWMGVLGPPKDGDATYAALASYTLLQTVARYLAATTRAPNPIAGALRVIALEALELVGRSNRAYDARWIRPSLGVFERVLAATEADDWLADRFLLPFERVTELELRHGRRMHLFAQGLTRVASLLRGDEQIGADFRAAIDLAKEKNNASAVEARELFFRAFRASGTTGIGARWSELAEETLPPAEAVDVHWCAAYASPGQAVSWVRLAKSLFSLGAPDVAFEALVRGMPNASGDWRKKALADLVPQWQQSGLVVPIDLTQAMQRGLQAFQANDLVTALRCFKWCNAIDPRNAVTLKNLATIYARMDRTYECLRTWAEGEEKQVPSAKVPHFTAQTLMEEKKWAGAVSALRYAVDSFSTLDEWVNLAAAAAYAEDDETTILAHQMLMQARGGKLSNNELHQYVTALASAGEWQKAGTLAQQLYQQAAGDPTYVASASHALALASMGIGDFGNAVQWAQAALNANKYPENVAQFQDTLGRAQRGEQPKVSARRRPTDEAALFTALAAGDTITPLVELDKAAGRGAFLRAGLSAAEVRSESDGAPVPERARETASKILAETRGATKRDAAMARIAALAVRESAEVAFDPPVALGKKMTREELAQRIGASNAAMVSGPQMAPPRSLHEAARQELAKGVLAAAGIGQGPPPKPIELPDQDTRMAQAQAAAMQVQAGMGGDADPTVLPGTKLPKLSDYVKLLKGMQGGDFMGALSRAGLDMGTYSTLAAQWGQKLAADPVLNQKFGEMMAKA